MTDHRDPVEAWLSRDVELLPPQPGSFQRVRRRARRRKAVQAMTAAAGVVVIVAAAAVLPQVAGNLLPGGTGPEKAGSTAAGQSRSSQHSRHPAPRPSPASSAPQPGPPLSAVGSGSPPPANFEPTSVTFVGSHTGAVLGQGGQGGHGCAKGLCTAVAGTASYGRAWTAMAAPPVGAPYGSSGISQIRFLNLHDGWAYGPQLYATHDGGATWTPISALPGRIVDLAAVGGRAFALSATCTGQGPAFASRCTRFALYSTSAGSDRWRPVPGASGQGATKPGALQLTSSGGFLLAGHRLYSGPVTAGPWHLVTGTPGSQPPCLRPAARQLALIAPNGSDLYLTCGAVPAGGQPGGTNGTRAAGSLTLYLSADAGRSWQSRGAVIAQGTATSLAVSPGGVIILATTAGIWRSADAVSWHQALVAAPRGGFTFAGMTTAGQGVAIPANRALHELFVTHDGGRSWQPRPIR